MVYAAVTSQQNIWKNVAVNTVKGLHPHFNPLRD